MMPSVPTLSFEDRVVAVALANAQAFGFKVVGRSSTGNLAIPCSAVGTVGLKACILVPADLEQAKSEHTGLWG